MPDKSTYSKGVNGETIACEYLEEKGMIPLKKRYHSPFGEIDLILQDGQTLVFAEVKYRSTGRAHSGETAVNAAKQQRIVKTARCYLGENTWNGFIRFDIVEITADGVLHFENAFEGREW